MAQKVEVILIDDLVGGDADETVQFALDGVSYEIDLSTANAEALRGILAPYTEGGRRTGGRLARRRSAPVVPGQRQAASTPERTDDEPDPRKVRAWGEANGYQVSDRGRIAATLMAGYKAAH